MRCIVYHQVCHPHLGICRDLANEQDLVFNQLADYMGQNQNELRFTTANYLDFLQSYNDDNAMIVEGVSDTFKNLTPEQRQGFYKYMEIKDRADSSLRKTGKVPEKIIREFQATPYPYTQVDDKSRTQLSKDMDLLRKHKQGVNFGFGLGARGLKDITSFNNMQEFLRETKKKISDWNRRLDKISDDRLTLMCSGEFFKAMWVFDGHSQLAQALITEATCVRDLLRNDEHKKQLQKYLDENPQFVATGFYTNTVQAIEKTKDKIVKAWLTAYKIFYRDAGTKASTQTRIAMLNDLFDTKNNFWVHDKNLNQELIAVKHLTNKVYLPAILNSQITALAELPGNLASIKTSLNRYLKNTGPAGSMFILNALADEDIDIAITNLEGLEKIKALLDEATHAAMQNKQITGKLMLVEKKLAAASPQEEAALKQQKQSLQVSQQELLLKLKNFNLDIAKLIVPVGDPNAVVGIRITGLTKEQLTLFGYEASLLSKGVFRNYGVKGNAVNAMSTSNTLLPVVILLFQSYNFINAFIDYYNDKNNIKGVDVFFTALGASAAGLALIQTYLVTTLGSVFNAEDEKAIQLAQSASKYVTKTAGSATAIKIGYVNLFVGLAANIAASAAGSYAFYKNYERWLAGMVSDSSGESLSSAAAMAGTAGTVGIAAYNAGRASIGVAQGVVASMRAMAVGETAAGVTTARVAAWPTGRF